MATFPVTYIEFVIWLIMIFIQSENTYILFIIRLISFPFGFLSGVDCLAGERWLFISSTGVITLTQFDDGIAPLLASILIFGSGIVFWVTIGVIREKRKEVSDGIIE